MGPTWVFYGQPLNTQSSLLGVQTAVGPTKASLNGARVCFVGAAHSGFVIENATVVSPMLAHLVEAHMG